MGFRSTDCGRLILHFVRAMERPAAREQQSGGPLGHSGTVTSPTEPAPRPRDVRFAALGAVLAAAVGRGELEANHALRVLRHELRVMNVNSALKAAKRSQGAQIVIDRYTVEGQPVPKNGSGDALHCDHVNALRAADFRRLQSPDAWLAELPRFKEVACVTAAENYRLEKIEREGADGWAKYDLAGIVLTDVTQPG